MTKTLALTILILSATLTGCATECSTRTESPDAPATTYTQQGNRRIYPANYTDPNGGAQMHGKLSREPRAISLDEYNHPTEPRGANIPRD